jgi:Fic family protein
VSFKLDTGFHLVSEWGIASRLTPDILLELQRLAVNQIYQCAGHFRDDAVMLEGSKHEPPPHSQIKGLVDEMCSYVSGNWGTRTAVHLASYVMWRLNWIHPFFGGNGRTARAASYLVLCASLNMYLPGKKVIPEIIVERREHYQRALQAADEAWAVKQRCDVSDMEKLLDSALAEQLVGVHKHAVGSEL